QGARDRHAAPTRRRGRPAPRGGGGGRGERARGGAFRPRTALRRRDRPRRGPVPRGRRAGESGAHLQGGVVRIALFGAQGKVGSILASALEAAGHDAVDGRASGPDGCDAAVDFTRPDAVAGNVELCLAAGVLVVIGTTGLDADA